MAKMSRTEKYRELRESLHADFGEGLSTKQLSGYESRLNKIDSQNFAAPAQVEESAHEAAHAFKEKKEETAGTIMPAADSGTAAEAENKKYDTAAFIRNVNDEKDEQEDDSDYLDRVISEVKKYNIDQGNALSEDTQINILKAINVDETPARPVHTNRGTKKEDTADIPFKSSSADRSFGPAEVEEEPEEEKTVESISAQVRNLMNGILPSGNKEDTEKQEEYSQENSIKVGFPSEQATRQQMLNQTMQMRQQLDDYEDNLSEVSDKMRHTNRILNFVLMILIAALIVVLGVVIWMIIATK